ncbi:hypothetical protein L2E82_22800 [Cichorium intybus]|uniref:Uncharacterized protein n=1 Tax=Cichorium intybus TaxID=13427 RepID=A0ACB9DYE2_CICIN|nr:hypothetical protein L2E82_22800 [Cichorium intybus]
MHTFTFQPVLCSMQHVMQLIQCGLSVVQMICQYELIITTRQGVKDHINGQLLVDLHIQLLQPLHITLHSLHVSVERLSVLQPTCHEGSDYFTFLHASSLAEIFLKVLVHLIWPVVLVKPLQFGNHCSNHDAGHFGRVIIVNDDSPIPPRKIIILSEIPRSLRFIKVLNNMFNLGLCSSVCD